MLVPGSNHTHATVIFVGKPVELGGPMLTDYQREPPADPGRIIVDDQFCKCNLVDKVKHDFERTHSCRGKNRATDGRTAVKCLFSGLAATENCHRNAFFIWRTRCCC
ncbi:unnamed protein product [Ectocarpus sp. 6 AP-2014]